MNNVLVTSSNNIEAIEQIRSVLALTTSPHLLHVLHALQQRFLHISPEAVIEVATHLKLSISQVQSVVEFYAFFSSEPRGHFDLLFSNCTSCGYMANGDNLLQLLARRLGLEINNSNNQTRADGRVSLGQTSCIGMCDHGASLLLNGTPVTGLDREKIERIAALIDSATPQVKWPAELLRVDDNILSKGLLLTADISSGASLHALLERGAEATLDEITRSGLRGRGGAGFSTGQKWKFCREATGDAHYVVCNADEGEPGTFKDRVLLNSYADTIFEGMTLCGFIIGAQRGLLYLRGEYRFLLVPLQQMLAQRRQQNLLGENILGQTGFSFDIEIVVGAGAYICGEESALIESLEGKRGVPCNRPPFPVTHGYLGQPTVVNNVETFLAAAHIALHGSAWFSASGTEHSAGSKIISVSGDCAKPGVYEYPFGVSIRQILHDCGAHDVQAVQVSGPAGILLDNAEFNRTLGFEDITSSGALMIYNEKRNILNILNNFSRFFAHESCGFCTPCRVGTALLKNSMDKISNGHGTRYDVEEMQRIGQLVKRRSHCGLGQTAANHILDGLQRFPQAFEQHLLTGDFEPHFNLDAALEQAREISGRNDAAAHFSSSALPPSPAGGTAKGSLHSSGEPSAYPSRV